MHMLLPLLLFASSQLAWLPTTKQAIASLPLSEGRLAPTLVAKIKAVSGTVLGHELDELLAVSNVQEIIWRLHEQGAEDRAVALQEMLQERLEHGTVHSMHRLQTGESSARLVEFEDGLRAVFKTVHKQENSFVREQLLYRLDNLIGTHTVPLTTIRTVEGEEGSLQLYVENSWSALEVLIEKHRQLGLPNGLAYTGYSLFVDGITPPAAPAINTLRLLSLDGDYRNPYNYLLVPSGRQIAIDGGRAFTATEKQTQGYINHLQGHPQEYLISDSVVANVERHWDEIASMYVKPEFLQSTFTSYQEMVAKMPHREGSSKNSIGLAILQHLAVHEWQAADDLLKASEYYFVHNVLTYETANFLSVVRKHRDWQLLKWLHQRRRDYYYTYDTIDTAGSVLEYALSASDYEFATRLSALGVPTSPEFNVLHENLRSAVAQQLELDEHSFSWDAINWDIADWLRVSARVDFAYRDVDDTVVDKMIGYLREAIATGDMDAANSMLYNYASAASSDKQWLVLLDLFDAVQDNPPAAEWLATHRVMLELSARHLTDITLVKRLGIQLRKHLLSYVDMHDPDKNKAVCTIALNFVSRLVSSQQNDDFNFGIFFDAVTKLSPVTASSTHVTKEQLSQHMHEVLDIFKDNRVDESILAILLRYLDTL